MAKVVKFYPTAAYGSKGPIKPLQRSYTYPICPTKNEILVSRKNINKLTSDDKEEPVLSTSRSEDLENFSLPDNTKKPKLHLPPLGGMKVKENRVSHPKCPNSNIADENWNNNHLYRVDEDNNTEKKNKVLEPDFKEEKEDEDGERNVGTENCHDIKVVEDKYQQEHSEIKRSYNDTDMDSEKCGGDLMRKEKKRKRSDDVQNKTKITFVDHFTQSNQAFPKLQEVIEAITRKFQDDVTEGLEDFNFIITGSYYAAHSWRQHCIKANNVKDLGLLSFSDIDIFYSQAYKPKKNDKLDQNSQQDSAWPGFFECYYRNLEINGRIYLVNYIRRLDLSITGNSTQLRDFIQNHIDINLVQSGAMVTLCGKGFHLTDEYRSEAFEKFLTDPEHTVLIPDIVNTDSPGNSLIRVLTKSKKFSLPYQLPAREELAKVDFSRRPLVQKFMNGLWVLPQPLQREIKDKFDLLVSWGSGRKLTTFRLKSQKKQQSWVSGGQNIQLYYE